jgi:plastocyanin
MRVPLPLLATLGSLFVALGLAAVPLATVSSSTAAAQDMGDQSMDMGLNEIPIQMGEFFFDPADITTYAGQPTRFELENVGEFSHRLAFDWNGERLRSDSVRSGETQSWDFVFDTPGTYEIYCDVTYMPPLLHRDVGMVGTLTVLPADGM